MPWGFLGFNFLQRALVYCSSRPKGNLNVVAICFLCSVRLLHKNYTVILPEIHIIIPGGDDVGLLEGGGLLPDERVLDGLHRHAGGLPPGLQVLTRTYTTGAGYSIRKTAGQIPKKG